MKVYRILKWTKIDREGSFNEIHNFQRHGLISPSYSYLWKKWNIQNDGINTFGDDTQMNKYFFLSINDALWLATEENLGMNQLLELDLPESLLRKHVGLGYYGPLQVEFCIPYKELYEATTRHYEEYLVRALDFYNANLYVDLLNEKKGYQEIESLLSKVPYEGISMGSRLSIYPLFCFEPVSASSIEIEQSLTGDYQRITKELESIREKRYNFEERISSITGSQKYLTDFNSNYSRNTLFDFAYPILEEENKELKRILTKL